jgi:hypothetical protein
VLTVHEYDLAWALIKAAEPELNALERNYVYVTAGAGDTFATVHHLLKLIAVKQIPVQPHLVTLCRTWLGPYVGHEEYEYLRGLIESFVVPNAPKRLPNVTNPRVTFRAGWFASTGRQESRRARLP